MTISDQPQLPSQQVSKSAWILPKFWSVAKPFWTSEVRWSALAILVGIVAIVVGKVYSMVKLNEAGGQLFSSLQSNSQPRFYQAIWAIALFMAVQLVCIVSQSALTQWLEARWRRWLTDYLVKHWLAVRAFYRLRFSGNVDNPDQRIAEDVRLLTNGSLSLAIGLTVTVLTVSAFAGVLWTVSGSLSFVLGGVSVTIPGYMFWAALLYWLIGSAIGFALGRPLIGLNNRQQRLEADFRFALVRIREKAEGIALYGGEPRERTRAGNIFDLLYGNYLRIIRQNAKLLTFQTFLGDGPDILPYLAVAPRYFSGSLGLGEMMMIGNGFGQISRALSWLVNSYATYAEWHATVDRLSEFLGELRRLSSDLGDFEVHNSGDGSLKLEDAVASLPSGRAIISNVSFTLKPHENVLLKGSSGAGKSTLFRVMAGLWLWGRGALRLPESERMLFLPQQPYLPIGTLREAIAFPLTRQRGLANDESENALRAALDAVGLQELGGRLDEANHWEQTLSPGEQQRLAIAQALLVKPDWLFLDEATSALDEFQEELVYGALATLMPQTTIVSIGHRQSIERFHTRVFLIDGRTEIGK